MSGNEILIEIFLSCRAYLARVASRIVPPDEIEDIVQETYVRVCQFKSEGKIRKPRALMVKIARNLSLDHIKRAECRLTSPFEEDSESGMNGALGQVDETFGQVSSDEEFGQFCEAVRKLPLQCRRVFVLKKVYGHTEGEIAKELNLSESTVEKHIAKGMKLCFHYMFQHTENERNFARRPNQGASRQGSHQ